MQYDIIIIGAGPAGYVAAIRAGQLGMKTALIEKQYMGGMCINWGCIPTKSLIESARMLEKVREAGRFGVTGVAEEKLALDWKVASKRAEEIAQKLSRGIKWMLEKSNVSVITGEAVINGAGSVTVNNELLEANKIIIATGSRPAPLDVPVPKEIIKQIEGMLQWSELPANIVIYGKGAVSVELAQMMSMAGSRVTLISSDDDFLPGIDPYLVDFIWANLVHAGVDVIKGATIKGYEKGLLLLGDRKIPCDILLNASWRSAVIPPMAEKPELDEYGYISTDMDFETSIKGIYAIGDVTGKSYLAHAGSAQGIWLINHFKGIPNTYKLEQYPLNIYTTPEIAQIGRTETALKEENIPYKVSDFPLTANGKALAEGNTDGFIRILSDERYGQVLGVQIVAYNATDMISEAAAFMSIEGTIYDVAQTIHAHPTVSEIFMEAGFDAIDKAMFK
jgi:dihydrolipoamide dehydrogenase